MSNAVYQIAGMLRLTTFDFLGDRCEGRPVREIRQSQDTDLPPPRPALGPGERLIGGRVYYSAAWLSQLVDEGQRSPLSSFLARRALRRRGR